jgi:outer membrane lipoprotein-sorting protein
VSANRQRRRLAIPPLLAAVLVAGVLVLPRFTRAGATPSLPTITPEALVQRVVKARVTHLSGTIQMTADLGLPALPGGGPSWTSYLAGSHTVEVWDGGPGRLRVALPDGSQETDLVVHGRTVWLWRSASYTATRIVGRAGRQGTEGPETVAHVPPTPAEMARRLLRAVRPTTRVFVAGTDRVAGRPAYELGLAPRSGASRVGEVLIAVDAGTGLALRVEVFPRVGGGPAPAPALRLGFTQLSLSPPSPSNFTFAPPRGAKVRTGRLVAPRVGHGRPLAHLVGSGWDTVLVVPGLPARMRGALAGVLRDATPVQGGWGQGRLVETRLVDALVLPSGRVLVGAVTPATLEKVAGRLGGS